MHTQTNEPLNAGQKKLQMKIVFFMFLIPVLLFFGLIFGRYVVGFVAFDKIYSEGERTGVLLKLSEKGIFWKTWEGEIALGFGGAGVWNFSVDSESPKKEEIINELKKASLGTSFIKIHYTQRYGVRPWRADTSYLVDEVTFVNNVSQSTSQ